MVKKCPGSEDFFLDLATEDFFWTAANEDFFWIAGNEDFFWIIANETNISFLRLQLMLVLHVKSFYYISLSFNVRQLVCQY